MNAPETTISTDEQPEVPTDEQTGLRFEDPYWDDAFCAWWDPALRTCCS
jgi:hypothetical protein